MAEIPNAPIKRLLIEGSQNCRVSGSALSLSSALISKLVRQLGITAGQNAAASKRKTIKDEDVTSAWAQLTNVGQPAPCEPPAEGGCCEAPE